MAQNQELGVLLGTDNNDMLSTMYFRLEVVKLAISVMKDSTLANGAFPNSFEDVFDKIMAKIANKIKEDKNA